MDYYLQIKNWFEKSSLREKLFITLLSWVVIYLLFHLIFFKPSVIKKASLRQQISEKQNELALWTTKIHALNELSKSPLYKQWVKQQELIGNLHGQYKVVLRSSPGKQWPTVVQAILQSQKNIVLEEMKNLPPTAYHPIDNNQEKPDESEQIEQQQLILTAYGNYFDIMSYLEQLEKELPTLYWDRLDYEVVQYPIAKIKLEFSILYDKSNA